MAALVLQRSLRHKHAEQTAGDVEQDVRNQITWFIPFIHRAEQVLDCPAWVFQRVQLEWIKRSVINDANYQQPDEKHRVPGW